MPVCDYITIDEAKLLLGEDVTAMTAPSKSLFTSCGYTSVHGEGLTVYISDYGLPTVAQQFFEKTRDALKATTADDTLGVPAYSYAQTSPMPSVTLIALKGQQIVKLEATGPVVGLSPQLPRLRAIVQRVLGTLDVKKP
jgi:hypothetical protein